MDPAEHHQAPRDVGQAVTLPVGGDDAPLTGREIHVLDTGGRAVDGRVDQQAAGQVRIGLVARAGGDRSGRPRQRYGRTRLVRQAAGNPPSAVTSRSARPVDGASPAACRSVSSAHRHHLRRGRAVCTTSSTRRTSGIGRMLIPLRRRRRSATPVSDASTRRTWAPAPPRPPAPADQQPAADHQRPHEEEQRSESERRDRAPRAPAPAPATTVSAASHRGSAPTASAPSPSSSTKAPSSAAAHADRRVVDAQQRGDRLGVEPVDLQRGEPGRERADLDRDGGDGEPERRRRQPPAGLGAPDPGRDPGGEAARARPVRRPPARCRPRTPSSAGAPAGARTRRRASRATRACTGRRGRRSRRRRAGRRGCRRRRRHGRGSWTRGPPRGAGTGPVERAAGDDRRPRPPAIGFGSTRKWTRGAPSGGRSAGRAGASVRSMRISPRALDIVFAAVSAVLTLARPASTRGSPPPATSRSPAAAGGSRR